MKREIWFAAAGILTLVGMRVAADEGSENTRVDPAELIRAVIASENKIHDVESLLLRIEGKWTHTPKGIAAERADLEKQFPSLKITSERFPDLRPERTEMLELAFDRSRLREIHVEHDVSTALRIWDGRQTWAHTKYYTHEQESYFLDRKTETHFFHLEGLSWLTAGQHSFWWNPSRVKIGGITFHYDSADKLVTSAWGTPENFVLGGRQVHRQHDCHVLNLRRWSGVFLRRLYVGVDDRRVYGQTSFHSVRSEAKEIMGRVAKTPIEDRAAWEAWLGQLSPIDRRKAEQECLDELYKVAKPSVEHYYDDYREVSPGFWIPMKSGYSFIESDAEGEYETSRRDLRVVEVKVNTRLPDEMFVMEMQEGVKVYDARYDPPIYYTFKKNFSREEWQAILNENIQGAALLSEIKAGMDSRIGERAVEFPKTTWLNSKPLTWKDLKGRVVILDFWADWCGPCRNDLPLMESIHKGRDRSGITVIGVHTPTSAVGDVRKVVKKLALSYPICIDAEKPAETPGYGFLSSWYHVRGIPHAVVVDKQGRVAGHGSLDDALDKAEELATDPANE